MSMITKATIETILGLTAGTIPDSLYTWAVKQYYALTGFSSAEVDKSYTKIIGNTTLYLKLPYRNIKTIKSLTLDGTTQTFTIDSDMKFNGDTGLVYYTGGFGTGQKVVITCTLNTHTNTDLDDYLVTLLTSKGLAIFLPQYTNQVKSVKIGKYSKTFGNVDNSLDEYKACLEDEIKQIVAQLLGDDGMLKMGDIN